MLEVLPNALTRRASFVHRLHRTAESSPLSVFFFRLHFCCQRVRVGLPLSDGKLTRVSVGLSLAFDGSEFFGFILSTAQHPGP